MNCDELLTALNSFVDGEVDAAFCREFEEHLSGCHPCQVVVDNIRHTIALYRDGEPYPLPAEFHRRLRQLLRSKWQEQFGR